MHASSTNPIILYAEDDIDDFESVREALDQISSQYQLLHLKNGAEAVDYLKNGSARPGLVVLDLNMPVMDGKEVLHWLKDQEELKDIPVMIFTTSSREEDIRLCKNYNCTFFRKPTLYRDLLHIVQTMIHMCATGLAPSSLP
jgi:CheY-like chemotaxis protein